MTEHVKQISEHLRQGWNEDAAFVFGCRAAGRSLSELTDKEIHFLIKHFNYKGVRSHGDDKRNQSSAG